MKKQGMGNIGKQGIAVIALATMLSQALTPYAMAGQRSSKVKAITLVTESSHKAQVIKKELAKLGAKKDAGEQGLDQAFGAMANELLAHNVGLEDIRAFVLSEAGPQALVDFDQTVMQIHPDYASGMSVEEYAAILTEGMRSASGRFGASGLTWSGCSGVVIGAVLAVTGLIVAIIGIGKFESVEAVRADFAEQRRNRQSQYNSDVYGAKHRSEALQNELDVIPNRIQQADRDIDLKVQQISSNKDKIILLTELKSGDATKDADIQAKIDEIMAQNKQLETDVSGLHSSIDRMMNRLAVAQNELAYWSDPRNVEAEINRLTADYNLAVTQNLDAEAHEVALVPEQQRQAPYFLIGGGAALVGGIYLIIDGASDGGCR